MASHDTLVARKYMKGQCLTEPEMLSNYDSTPRSPKVSRDHHPPSLFPNLLPPLLLYISNILVSPGSRTRFRIDVGSAQQTVIESPLLALLAH